MNNLAKQIPAIVITSVVAVTLTCEVVFYSQLRTNSNVASMEPNSPQASGGDERHGAQHGNVRYPGLTPAAQTDQPSPADQRTGKVLVPVSYRERVPRSAALDKQIPSDHMQVRLIKNALIALNNANVTGNYSVLREMCSPGLRDQRKVSDFATAFHNSHHRSRDMSFVMELKPIPSQPVTMTSAGRMRLRGYFPTKPLVLRYDLVFLHTVRGDWWIDDIVLATQRSPN